MKKVITIIVILLFAIEARLQTIDFDSLKPSIVNLGEVSNSNEDFTDFSDLKTILQGVEIVMLGEQSHGEGTVYDTKIKLVKYLHQELGFDLLVFESGFYDCKKAWEKINEGEDIRLAMGKSIHGVWSTTYDLKPLAKYLEQSKELENPLKLLGFDNQLTGKYSNEFFLEDLSKFLDKINPSILESKEWEHLSTNINNMLSYKFKKVKKNQPKSDKEFIDYLIIEIRNQETQLDADFWIQTLKSLKAYLSDTASLGYDRDKQMADNLIWIKEKYPNSKIICWGATSHFLYNSKNVRMKNPIIQLLGGRSYKKDFMMGHYIKNKYKDRVYTIGFTAYEGKFGLWRTRKIKTPKKGSLEYLLAQSKFDNYLLPLNGRNFKGMKSRPIGNFYMKNNIEDVMDAVIFNRNMNLPRLDRNFFLKIYPENKYIKPEVEN